MRELLRLPSKLPFTIAFKEEFSSHLDRNPLVVESDAKVKVSLSRRRWMDKLEREKMFFPSYALKRVKNSIEKGFQDE